jgi:hypothetical protein
VSVKKGHKLSEETIKKMSESKRKVELIDDLNYKCDYGCGKPAKYKLNNEKLCCSRYLAQCKEIRLKNSLGNKDKEGNRKGFAPWNKGKTGVYKEDVIKSIREKSVRTIEKINKKYLLFSIIEEMRYNPDKIEEKEIQVHCKNHSCLNSKEKGGWFTPTAGQTQERIRSVEKTGRDLAYFYCSQECKDICPLYNVKGSKFIKKKEIYTHSEYQTFRHHVLTRDNNICQFCGNKAIDVHHERPQKLEPLFVLDPDYAWSCCEKCHYEKGHKDECSAGKIASIKC